MAFVRTYGDGTPVEVLRNRYKAPMQSEKIWIIFLFKWSMQKNYMQEEELKDLVG